ncbi:MAG TPA: PAS domain-containing protein, partial [Daejeonella sp.]|nr:PAS domain-containing protein [Daejeonella sp.]
MRGLTVNYPFLKGGGEMGELIRSFNWSETSLGSPDGWPQSLQTALSIILNSRFPMFLFWGPELIQFYNDAYRPSLGKNGKHPNALGTSGYDTWKEIWDTIGPIIVDVLENESSVWHEDQLLPIYRNGHLENVYWTYSYSPLNNEDGIPQGVFVTCYESTEKMKAFDELQKTRDMYQFAIEAAELGVWDFNLATKRFTVNSRLRDWFKLSEEYLDLNTVLKMVPTSDQERVRQAIDAALHRVDGGAYDIEHSIICEPGASEKRVRVKGKVLFDRQRQPYRFNGTLQDITKEETDRKALIESESHLRNLFSQIPAAVSIFKGPDFIIEVINDRALEYWQKSYAEVINRPLFEAFPLIAGTNQEQLLRRVFESGERYEGKELEMEFPRSGGSGNVFINYIYEPYIELDGTISGVMV